MIALSCSNTRCCSFLKPVIPNRWTSRRAWNKQTVVKVTFKLEKDNLFNNLPPFPSWVPPVGHFVSSLISVGSWWDGVIKPTTDRKNRAFVHRFITLLQQLPKDLNWKKAKLWEKWKQKRGKKTPQSSAQQTYRQHWRSWGLLSFLFLSRVLKNNKLHLILGTWI